MVAIKKSFLFHKVLRLFAVLPLITSLPGLATTEPQEVIILETAVQDDIASPTAESTITNKERNLDIVNELTLEKANAIIEAAFIESKKLSLHPIVCSNP